MSGRGAVVVSGASTGIGRACALHLDSLGFEVHAGVRREVDGESLRAEASERLRTPILDVTDAEQVAALAAAFDGKPLAGLVNNAGIAVGGPLEYLPVERVRWQLEVNVIGLLAMTQALLPALRAGAGRVVNIGSIGGRRASPFVGPYAASKHAVEAITDALRQELRPWGLHVSVIEPGAVATPIWDKGAQSTAELAAELPPSAHEHYGKAIASVGELTTKMNARGVPPLKVARVVEHALTARRPRTRYLVGPEAHVQAMLGALLPDRAMDAVVARFMGI